MLLDRQVYALLESVAPYLIIWVFLFYVISIILISLNLINSEKTKGYGSVISELPGLPLIFMHSVAFFKAINCHDYVSAFLFLWWGPGFFVFAAVYLYGKISKVKINWAPWGLITSYACKADYVIFMAIYYYFDMPTIMFTFSAWIICDQINLAWFLGTSDRAKRTFEDFWILRVLYPGLLFIMLFYQDIAYRKHYLVFGLFLFTTWIFALYRLVRQGLFFTPYKNTDYLRNIVYLSSRYRKK